MTEIILTESQRTQCSMQTLDLITKAAVAGAIGYVIWHTFVKEGIAGADLPREIGRRLGSRLSKRFGLGRAGASVPVATSATRESALAAMMGE